MGKAEEQAAEVLAEWLGKELALEPIPAAWYLTIPEDLYPLLAMMAVQKLANLYQLMDGIKGMIGDSLAKQ